MLVPQNNTQLLSQFSMCQIVSGGTILFLPFTTRHMGKLWQ